MFAWLRTVDSNILNDTSLLSVISRFPVDTNTVVRILSPFIVQSGTTLNISSVNSTQNAGGYICVVLNEAGGTISSIANLYVRPEITTQPMDQFVNQGDTVMLTCIADSFPAPTYQWQRMNTTTSEFEDLSRETATTYTINDIEHEDFGIYRCVVTTPTINVTINSRDTIIAGKFYTKFTYVDFTFQFLQMKVFLLNHHFRLLTMAAMSHLPVQLKEAPITRLYGSGQMNSIT